jgi:acyl carrier protein
MEREIFMSAMAETLGLNIDEVNETTVLDDNNWDSLAHMAAISAIDERFGVTISAKELTGARTVGELMQLVQQTLPRES